MRLGDFDKGIQRLPKPEDQYLFLLNYFVGCAQPPISATPVQYGL
jgi:hypothetical protein